MLRLKDGDVPLIREILECGVDMGKQVEAFVAKLKSEFEREFEGFTDRAAIELKEKLEQSMDGVLVKIMDYNAVALDLRCDFDRAARNQERCLPNEAVFKRMSNQLNTFMPKVQDLQINFLSLNTELNKAVEAAREQQAQQQKCALLHLPHGPKLESPDQLDSSSDEEIKIMYQSPTLSTVPQVLVKIESKLQESEVTGSRAQISPELVTASATEPTEESLSSVPKASPDIMTGFFSVKGRKRPLQLAKGPGEHQQPSKSAKATKTAMKSKKTGFAKVLKIHSYHVPSFPLTFTRYSFYLENILLKKGKCANCGDDWDASGLDMVLCARCQPWLHFNCLNKKVMDGPSGDGQGDKCFFCEKMKNNVGQVEYETHPRKHTVTITEEPVSPDDLFDVPQGSRTKWKYYWNKFCDGRNIKIGDVVYCRRLDLERKLDCEEVNLYFVDLLVTDANGKAWAEVQEYVFPEQVMRSKNQKFYRQEVSLTDSGRDKQYIELTSIVGPPVCVLPKQEYLSLRPRGSEQHIDGENVRFEHVYIERHYYDIKKTQHFPIKKSDFRICPEFYAFKKLRSAISEEVFKPDMQVDSPYFARFNVRFPLTSRAGQT